MARCCSFDPKVWLVNDAKYRLATSSESIAKSEDAAAVAKLQVIGAMISAKTSPCFDRYNAVKGLGGVHR